MIWIKYIVFCLCEVRSWKWSRWLQAFPATFSSPLLIHLNLVILRFILGFHLFTPLLVPVRSILRDCFSSRVIRNSNWKIRDKKILTEKQLGSSENQNQNLSGFLRFLFLFVPVRSALRDCFLSWVNWNLKSKQRIRDKKIRTEKQSKSGKY